jgi:hypothetical protein
MWFKLSGDARLGRCATEGCGGQPTERLEAGGVGSNYCSGCRSLIEAQKPMGDQIELAAARVTVSRSIIPQ